MKRFGGLMVLLAALAAVGQAQVVTGSLGTQSAGVFACSAQSANPTAARPTGYAELLGDIVITCTGGANVAPGSPVPTANITVALNNTIVTSRVFGNGLSEALLVIDDAGAGSGVGPGALLPQTLCSGGALGAASGGCETYANPTASSSAASTCVAMSGGNCATFGATPNVFQGAVSANQVVFNGIPILAPVTSGLSRTFRITNVRANAAQFAGQASVHQGQIPILASIVISGSVNLGNAVVTTSFLFDGLSSGTTVRNADNSAAGTSINMQQCAPSGMRPGAVLRFAEGIAAAFKTRISRTATLSGAGTPANSKIVASAFTQNVPGAIYTDASESGFILDASGGTAGLSNFGTRLKATFRNVPAGVGVYVSTTNINPLSRANGNLSINAGTDLTAVATAVGAGKFQPNANVKLIAGLVPSESAAETSGQGLPLVAPAMTVGGVALFGPLPVDANGTATATWEVLLADPNEYDFADFAVFYETRGPMDAPATGTVTLTMGPTSSTPTSSALAPRFSAAAVESPLINVAVCARATVTLASSPNPATYGQTVTVTVRVTGTTGTPTGTVTVKEATDTLQTLTLSGGQASFTYTPRQAAWYPLTAVYAGDGTFPAATSSTLTQMVVGAPTTTSLSVPQESGRAGQTAWFSATVSSTVGTPTGSVTFRDGTKSIGTAMLDSNGAARIGANLTIGRHVISASYNGSANLKISTSDSQPFSVDPIPTSVSTPGLRSGTPVAGQALTFEATVSSDGGPVTSGMITFRDGWTTLGSSGLDRSGTGSITATMGAGNHMITASYGGYVMNGSATSGPLFLTVKGESTVTVVSSLNPAGFGAAVTFTATVAGSVSGTAPTGTVSFEDGGRALGSAAVNASGQAALTVAAGLAAGDHSITATYGGDTNYTGATSAAVAQKVEKAATTTTLSESAGRNGFTLTGTVAAANGSPTGSVDFVDVTAGATLGSAGLANGAASVILGAPLPVGHLAQAAYRGDATFAGSSSAAQVLVAATNGFSFGMGFAPDAVSSLFGAGLAGSTAAATEMPLATTLAGVTVKVVDSEGRAHAAGLYYVSPTQINFVMPGDVPAGAARVVVTTGDRTITVAILVTTVEPALASADGSGSGAAAAQVMRAHVEGAEDRLYVVLYGTGLRHASGPVTCMLNGATVAPLWMGAHSVYAGLDQINLEVPANVRGRITAACSADGVTSNSVTVTAQ